MPAYVSLSLVVLSLVTFAALLRRRKLGWRAIVSTLIVLVGMTAVFDNAIIAAGIVAYDTSKISGILIGLAPIEDFAYTIAAVVIIPILWQAVGNGSDA